MGANHTSTESLNKTKTKQNKEIKLLKSHVLQSVGHVVGVGCRFIYFIIFINKFIQHFNPKEVTHVLCVGAAGSFPNAAHK